MSDQTQPHRPKAEGEAPAGVNIEGRAGVSVGGDVAGRDVVKTTTTQVGFSEAAVQRLVWSVGVLVFITATCFFAGGVAAGGIGIALARPVMVWPHAADSMQAKLDALQAMAPGDTFQATFTEEELNSYFQLVVGPQVGLAPGSGAVRLLPNHQVLVAGQSSLTGPTRLAAILEPRLNSPGQPFKLDSAAIQILPLGSSRWGWVPLPTAVLQPLVQQLNDLVPSGLEFSAVADAGDASQPAIELTGTAH